MAENIIVSKKSKKTFHTIQDAIDFAKDGDSIFIESGVYNESILVNKNLVFFGDKSDVPVISIESGTTCKIKAPAAFNNLYFNNVDGVLPEDNKLYGFIALVEVGGSSVFNDCKFSGAFTVDVQIYGENTKAEFNNCIICNANRNGMFFIDGSEGLIRNCQIFDNGFHGISIVNSSVTVENTKIHDVGGHGIMCVGNCNDEKRFYEDGESVVCKESSISVTNTEIYNLQESDFNGIYMLESSSGVFTNCKIHDINKGMCIKIDNSTEHVFKDCIIYNDNFYSSNFDTNLNSDDNEKCLKFSASSEKGLEIKNEENPDFYFEENILYDKNKKWLLKVFSDLTDFEVPESVENIGKSAISDCFSLENIKLPETVKSLGDCCFLNCPNLKKINIPSGISTIPFGAFAYCMNLCDIKLSENIKSIEDLAFYNCGNIQNIGNVKGVTDLGSNVFENCENLTAIEFSEKLTSIKEGSFKECKHLETIKAPGITYIGNNAFENCENLNDVEFSENLTTIGEAAFKECKSLKNVNTSGISDLGGHAFENCVCLENINFAQDLSSIKEYSFWNCTALSNVTIPSRVNSIGEYAFFRCQNFTNIEIPDSVLSIGTSTFERCENLTNIKISKNANFIGSRAFYDCINITKIELPKGITSIEDGVFMNCENLTKLVIPEHVNSIEGWAFFGCSNLTSVNIPETITSIEEHTFYGCRSLESIKIPDGVVTIGESAFYGCERLENIDLPDGITSIGSSAFEQCENIVSIEIPQNVTSIADSEFSFCHSLENIKMPDTIVSIGNWAFSSCSNLRSIKLTNSLVSIGERAFDGCSKVASIDIPNSVTEIGEAAFMNCNIIKSLTIPEGVTHLNGFTFWCCYELERVKLPKHLTSMGKQEFWNCKKLRNIEIPEGVTSIGDMSFHCCENLESIKLPSTLTFIDHWGFSVCEKLDNLIIPQSVTNIGEEAFRVCENLRELNLPDNLEYVSSGILEQFDNDVKINLSKYVPSQFDSEIIPRLIISNAGSLAGNNLPPDKKELWIKYFRSNIDIYYEDIAKNKDFLEVMMELECIYIDDIKTILEIASRDSDVNLSAILLEYEHNNFTQDEIDNVTMSEFDLDIKNYHVIKNDNTLSIIKYIGTDTNIIIPETLYSLKITNIDNEVFSVNQEHIKDEEKDIRKKIQSIEIPDSVSIIGEKVFDGLTNLESLIFPEKIESISESTLNEVFFEFKKLKSIKLPEGITSIPDKAFSKYRNLQYVYIPSTVCSIGEDIFTYCNNLSSIEVADNNKNYYVKDGKLYDKSNNKVLYYLEKIEVQVNEDELTSLPKMFESEEGIKGTDDYILFGDWPQSLKEDSVTIDEMYKYNINGFECYKGSDDEYYVKQEALPGEINNFNNGEEIKVGNYYYFKMESIKWNILSSPEEKQILVSDKILFSSCFYNGQKSSDSESEERKVDGETIYVNNYKYSTIRAYLNGLDGTDYNVENFKGKGFINKAFSSCGQKNILNYFDESRDSLRDKVALLSEEEFNKDNEFFAELSNSLGFDFTKKRVPTDFSIALGIELINTLYSDPLYYYLLRSPYSEDNNYVGAVGSDCYCNYISTNSSGIGVVVAIKLNKKS